MRALKPTKALSTKHSRSNVQLRLQSLEDRSVPANFNVTTPLDIVDPSDGLLSLREAVLLANASPSNDVISLPAGEFALTISGANEDGAATGDLDVLDELRIVGTTDGDTLSTTITSQHGDRLFDVHSSRLTLDELNMRGGGAQMIFALDSNVELTRASLIDGRGGAVYLVGGQLRVSNSQFSDCLGSAIHTTDASVNITKSDFTGNRGVNGGAIHVSGGSIDITESQFHLNSAVLGGGALYLSGCQATASKLSMTYNYAGRGGAIYLTGSDAVFNHVTLSNNGAGADSGGLGGGIYVADGALSLRHSTLIENAADRGGNGGGLYLAGGTTTLFDCLFDTNTASNGYGGAIYCAGGSLMALQSSFVRNIARIGGGIYIEDDASVCIDQHTLDAFLDNRGIISDPDIFGDYTLC